MRFTQIASLLALNQVYGVFGQGSGCNPGTVLQAYSDKDCSKIKTKVEIVPGVEAPVSLMLPSDLQKSCNEMD